MIGSDKSTVLDLRAKGIENSWNRMIEQVSIKNFRCFADLVVSELKPINIIVGPNSSGKSAFVESVFLSSSSTAANVVFQMRAIRRIGGALQVPSDSLGYKGVWEDLFFNFDAQKRIAIQIKGSAGDQRSLQISLKEGTQQELSFGKEVPGPVGLPQITFVWRRGGGKEIVIKPTLTTTGLQMGTATVDHFPVIWFTPGSGDPAEETARRYSALSKRNEISPIVTALQAEFDFIEALSIEFLAGVPQVFASVRGSPNKMPLGLVSDGVNRLLAILVGIAYYKDGVVLIDQLEDGIYYERFPSVWDAVKLLFKV
jgi:hypothetical protein